jgi:hypothetical protein
MWFENADIIGQDRLCSQFATNSHTNIAESAAIGAYDEIKGQAIHCFAVVRQGVAKGEPELKKEILQIILRNLGAIARPAAIHIVKGLPKTRSGKIVRRAIQAVVEGKHLGDLSTLEDYIAIEGLKSVLAEARLQELRNEVRNRAFAIWLGRVQGGEEATLGMHRPIGSQPAMSWTSLQISYCN